VLKLTASNVDADNIAEKVGPMWKVHGGNLREKCRRKEGEWREIMEGVKRKVIVHLRDFNGYWGTGGLIEKVVLNVAKKLGKQVTEAAVLRHIDTTPYPKNRNFLGRDGKLARMVAILEEDQGKICISSIGGMGETQLALEYGTAMVGSIRGCFGSMQASGASSGITCNWQSTWASNWTTIGSRRTERGRVEKRTWLTRSWKL
jgi:hypothetical protein